MKNLTLTSDDLLFERNRILNIPDSAAAISQANSLIRVWVWAHMICRRRDMFSALTDGAPQPHTVLQHASDDCSDLLNDIEKFGTDFQAKFGTSLPFIEQEIKPMLEGIYPTSKIQQQEPSEDDRPEET